MSRSAAAMAHATSARLGSDSRRTYSSGLCALPPRGPSPSTVSGTCWAMWLPSLPPPPSAPTPRPATFRPDDGRPEPLAGRREQIARLFARIHAGPLAHERGLEPGAADVVGQGFDHPGEGVQALGVEVAEQLAVRGHHVEGVAGVDDGRDGAEPVGAGRVV